LDVLKIRSANYRGSSHARQASLQVSSGLFTRSTLLGRLHVWDDDHLYFLYTLPLLLLSFGLSFIAMLSFRLFGLALVHILPTFAEVSRGSRNCTCGFYDSQTEELFTDSIIVYFNESTTVPNDFVAEKFTQNYAKDWVCGYGYTKYTRDPS
jgi:hypothetical protein